MTTSDFSISKGRLDTIEMLFRDVLIFFSAHGCNHSHLYK